MSLRFHEIAEQNHKIINPFTEEKLMLLGEICQFTPATHQLDLCCGKAEMLCRWSERWGISGTGIDISHVFLEAAKVRANELGVAERLTLIEGDAGAYSDDVQYDVVSCIGATWIGNGLVGTIDLMNRQVKADGLLLVGEPYWIATPPDAAYQAMGVGQDDFVSLPDTLERIESTGYELVEMVLANQDSWDRYEAQHWIAINNWLREHADDPDAEALRQWNADNKRSYLQYGRQYLGWGVFVLKKC